jgi:hypothetical protein
MKRRTFVQAAMTSLAIPAAAIAAPATPPILDAPAWNGVFFDERFPAAKLLARRLAGFAPLTAVQGDVTPLWTATLARASRTAPVAWSGVTTESFYFCLKILLGEPGRIEAQSTRIDRDLYRWTIRTRNSINNGTVS